MSFVYPLFLAAGATLLIPVLIHLFNLRKYKTVFFPHTRFLRDLQLNSRRQSQIRYKWLLAARILFLALLVLAFAQPFWGSDEAQSAKKRVQVIYLDNSYSMSAKKGARMMLDVAKQAAAKQVKIAPPGSRFVLITNEKPNGYMSEQADKVYAEIQATDITATPSTLNKTLAYTQAIMEHEGADAADLYYYSDFQQGGITQPDSALTKGIRLMAVAVQPEAAENIYIDTAYLTSPVLQADKPNSIVVHTHLNGDEPTESPVLTLTINGQMKAAASLKYADEKERMDTLEFQASGTGWQKIVLSLNDLQMRYDDTFRVGARCSPNLSVLVMNEGTANPYIQASFRAYDGFRLNQTEAGMMPADRKQYNLLILNGVTRISNELGIALASALDDGQTICIFPGRTSDYAALNEGLKQIGDLTITGIDTAVQTASQLQQGSPLVRDLFEKIPDNVQLPTASWHYRIAAGLGANQESVLSFRNGDPLLAGYHMRHGNLYMSSVAADLQSGNFPGSYFFTPFLYQMAVQSTTGSVFSLTAGSNVPVFMNMGTATERDMVHAYANATDIVPPQRPSGAGVDIYLGQVVNEPGFYALATAAADSAVVGVNPSKTESIANYLNEAAFKKATGISRLKWMQPDAAGDIQSGTGVGNFPLWKVCVILALVMLALETYLLARQKTVKA